MKLIRTQLPMLAVLIFLLCPSPAVATNYTNIAEYLRYHKVIEFTGADADAYLTRTGEPATTMGVTEPLAQAITHNGQTYEWVVAYRNQVSGRDVLAEGMWHERVHLAQRVGGYTTRGPASEVHCITALMRSTRLWGNLNPTQQLNEMLYLLDNYHRLGNAAGIQRTLGMVESQIGRVLPGMEEPMMNSLRARYLTQESPGSSGGATASRNILNGVLEEAGIKVARVRPRLRVRLQNFARAGGSWSLRVLKAAPGAVAKMGLMAVVGLVVGVPVEIGVTHYTGDPFAGKVAGYGASSGAVIGVSGYLWGTAAAASATRVSLAAAPFAVGASAGMVTNDYLEEPVAAGDPQAIELQYKFLGKRDTWYNDLAGIFSIYRIGYAFSR